MIVDAGSALTPENIQLSLSIFETQLGVVHDVPNNDPQRIKQEIVPSFIPRTNENQQSIDLSIPGPNIPFGVLPKEYAPRTKYVTPDRERQLRDDQERQLHESTAQEWIRNYKLHQQLVELGFDDYNDYPSGMQTGDTIDRDTASSMEYIPLDMEAGEAEPRIRIYGDNPRFSPQHLPGVSFTSRPEPIRLFNLFQDNVATGSISSVSNTIVPKDVAVMGGAEKREKKKRAPPGTHSRTKPPDPDFRTGDIIGNQIVPRGTKNPFFNKPI